MTRRVGKPRRVGNPRRATNTRREKKPPTIWDWPLRLWHWAFAGFLAFSLYSGLAGDIGLLEWHQRSGLTLLGLVVFRLGWAAWGGIYARFRHYWTTPRAVFAHFRGRAKETAHTAPGIALVVLLFLAVAGQITAGLFTTDDIFTEGPLYGLVAAEVSSAASWIHHRLHWLILAAIGVHLTAHAVYGFVLRDRTPLAMVTGRKPVDLPSTPHFWLRAGFTLALALGVVALVANAERWFG